MVLSEESGDWVVGALTIDCRFAIACACVSRDRILLLAHNALYSEGQLVGIVGEIATCCTENIAHIAPSVLMHVGLIYIGWRKPEFQRHALTNSYVSA